MHGLLWLASFNQDNLNESKLQRRLRFLKKNRQSPISLGRQKNFTSCINSQFIKQMQSISYFAFSHKETFQKHSATCTSHSQIIHITFKHLSGCWFVSSSCKSFSYKTNKARSSSNPCFFLLQVPAQVTLFNIPGNYLTFSSMTQGLGEFLHKINQTCVLRSISCAKHKNIVKGKQVHIQELPCHFKNDQ